MQRTGIQRRGGIQRRRRIQGRSAKRKSQMPVRKALVLGLGIQVGWRCEYPPCGFVGHLDGHEVRKPRARYWLNPEYVVMLCRRDHERAEAAFNSSTGRLVITGTRSEGWEFTTPPYLSKFEMRAALIAGG